MQAEAGDRIRARAIGALLWNGVRSLATTRELVVDSVALFAVTLSLNPHQVFDKVLCRYLACAGETADLGRRGSGQLEYLPVRRVPYVG